jgi:hypothetical protein
VFSESHGDELSFLFHQLNNQLGIILACAELLEVRAADDTSRARSAEVVAKVLDALGTTKQLRQHVESRAAESVPLRYRPNPFRPDCSSSTPPT